MNHQNIADKRRLDEERAEILQRLESALEIPMLVLGFVWLALLIIELVWGLQPWLEALGLAIWVIFILDFALKFILAPSKTAYLRSNWLTAIALFIPALRLFRIFRLARVLRAARTARGIRLVRVLSSLNRGMRALGASLKRRGFGYVVTLTLIITLAGAAGMYAFESHNPDGRGLNNFGSALWWTAMLVTTMGSEYWPQTPEGRVLCLILALYAFAVFGYVTATLAAFFIGREADDDAAELAGAKAIAELRAEIVALRAEINAFTRREKP